MKFRFVALALLAATASVASAHVLMPVPAQNGTSPHSNGLSLPFPIAAPPTAVPLKLSALPARSALESGTTRSPVPLLLGQRRPFVPAAEASWASSSQDGEAPPAGKMTETAAKAAIEADGYKAVRALSRGPDGTWKARALRGGTEVQLSVNPAGDVSAN